MLTFEKTFSISHVSRLEQHTLFADPTASTWQKELQKMLLVLTRYNQAGTESKKDFCLSNALN